YESFRKIKDFSLGGLGKSAELNQARSQFRRIIPARTGSPSELRARIPGVARRGERAASARSRGALIALDPENRAFAQPDDRLLVLLVELRDPFLPGLALVGRGGIRVEVVRVHAEGNDPQSGEARRLHDRHVVGRADRRTRDVRAGARPDVRPSVPDASAQ